MGFKLENKDCENILRGQNHDVLERRLIKLGSDLMNESEPAKMYRIQGQMLMLIEVIGLRDKAAEQLQRAQ